MNNSTNTSMWAEYSSEGISVKGLAKEAGMGMYWFKDVDTFKIEGVAKLAKSYEVKILPLDIHKEDIEMMIDMALDTGDKEWFNELYSKLQ